MSKSFGLALGSGGARGVAHLGFLMALEEAGIKPDYITGCSMGAVVGGVFASGVSAAEMSKLVLNFRKRDLLDPNPVAITQASLLRGAKMHRLLTKNLKCENIEDFPIKFKCVATDVLSGKLHVFESGNAAKAIQASSSIPTVFKPVKIEDKLLVDGGCMCRIPIRQVKEMGADVVVAIDALTNCKEPVKKINNIIEMILRVFDIMDQHNTDNMMKEDGALCDLLLEPNLPGVSQYEIKDLEKTLDEGYALGKANIEKIKELIG